MPTVGGKAILSDFQPADIAVDDQNPKRQRGVAGKTGVPSACVPSLALRVLFPAHLNGHAPAALRTSEAG